MTPSSPDRPQGPQGPQTVAWIVVTVILLGVVTAALGMLAGFQAVVIGIGGGMVVTGVILAVVLPKTKLGRAEAPPSVLPLVKRAEPKHVDLPGPPDRRFGRRGD